MHQIGPLVNLAQYGPLRGVGRLQGSGEAGRDHHLEPSYEMVDQELKSAAKHWPEPAAGSHCTPLEELLVKVQTDTWTFYRLENPKSTPKPAD